ncbi:30S ribosomal protein S2 [Candidatus Woesearchaeota archaeon]|nr:30S ribosomal protein S2 [Candidatus Woesearchaeota archaeon]
MPEPQKELLIEVEEYLKSGIHIGTKFKNKYMQDFIYKVRPDGLSIMNLETIDERLRIMIDFLSRYAPEEILVVSRRENSHRAVKLMSKLTGIRAIAGRYPPGTLTNPALSTFTEAKVVFVTDPWPDKNAVIDAYKVGIPIVALCDTNNTPLMIDLVVPCNNKGKKSLALIFYLFTKNYMLKRGMLQKESDFKYNVEDFLEK